MQLLVRYDFDAFDTWQQSYDRHGEERGRAGLRQLQLWREGTGTVWGLYDISERADAEAHLNGLAALEGKVAARHYLSRL